MWRKASSAPTGDGWGNAISGSPQISLTSRAASVREARWPSSGMRGAAIGCRLGRGAARSTTRRRWSAGCVSWRRWCGQVESRTVGMSSLPLRRWAISLVVWWPSLGKDSWKPDKLLVCPRSCPNVQRNAPIRSPICMWLRHAYREGPRVARHQLRQPDAHGSLCR